MIVDTKTQKWRRYALRTFIMLAVPALLLISSIRLVMSPLFLQLEYTRPGFPADVYGFSTDDRLRYGPLGIAYIFNAEGIDFLADQRLPGELCFPPQRSECPLFGADELRHMEDVKFVAQGTFAAGLLLALLTAGAAYWLWRSPNTRYHLRFAAMQGALLTLAIVFTVVVIAVSAWEYFFDTFHEIFFEDGTWRFFYSDTLIRLYPEQFWFEAAIVIGVLTTLGAVLLLALTWGLQPMRKRRSTSESAETN